ncbi:MAG: 3-dehydroquinate synthase [Planctomycetes bacterium]|nr:3-dehydroquinate synthase [Planctomycetota bacterium]
MDRSFEFARRAVSRIVVGTGVEARLPDLLRELGTGPIVLVHDRTMAAAADRLAARLGDASCLAIPPGEAAKDLDQIAAATRALRHLGADRGVTLLAFGGGSVTDAVGFLASVWLRGVRFVACPTTTLAICDAALGGKNGVDLDGRKNELGTIRQPDLVVGDTDWLRTLPDALWREGFVEVVKMAAVLDAAHFAELERLAPALRARDAAAAQRAIDLAIAMKMAVVLADETEQDRRRWLNFGHTIGHALESLANGALRHGECVAIGMLAECRAAGAAVPAAVQAQLTRVLQALDAPTAWPRQFGDVGRLWALAVQDKKAHAGVVPMVVPGAIGTGILCELTRDRLAAAV